MENFIEWLERNNLSLIWTAVAIFITMVLLFLIGLITKRIIKRNKNKRFITIARLVQSIARFIVMIVSFIAILAIWRIDIMPIIAGAGIIGLIIGLGAQQLIRDLLAGISIVLENYYDVGDIVEIKGFKGTVEEVGLRSTRIVGWRGDLKIIANGDITEITNFSKNPTIGVVEIGIAFKEDLNRVLQVYEENLHVIRDAFPQVIEGPNVVGVIGLANNAQTIRITVKTTAQENYEVERAIYRLSKELFEKNNIEIAYGRTAIYDDK